MVELFAGVGGFRLGLEPHGFTTVWANQWEPSTRRQHAFEVYVAQFGNKNASNDDINKIDKTTIPDHNLLVGGFPCQDYSVARTKAEGIVGKKGVLWWSIYETLKVKKPPFALLENVDRLIKSPASQRGRDFGVMLRTIYDLGYGVEWRVINAADYGHAQRRRRVFLFLFHKDTRYYKNISSDTMETVIFENGFFADKFKLDETFSPKRKPLEKSLDENKYKDLVKVSDNFEAYFHNSGIMLKGSVYSIETKPKQVSPTPLKDVLERNVDTKYFIEDQPEKIKKLEWMKSSKKEPRTDKNGYQYFYSEGGMSFPDLLGKPARTILTSETSINRSTHVITDPETSKKRFLTPTEVERLNGFPDNWTKPDGVEITDKKRYFFMGNALVVDLIKVMGETLESIFIDEVYKSF